jgi:hypothetical protein
MAWAGLASVRPEDEREGRIPTAVVFFFVASPPKPSAMQMAPIAIADYIIAMNGLRQKGVRFCTNLS